MTLPKLTEKEFLVQVRELAELTGWLHYHTHDSRRSEPGFPDLVLVRDDRIIFAELKVGKGKMTDEQLNWMSHLSATGKVETWIWHPDSWDLIEQTLNRGR